MNTESQIKPLILICAAGQSRRMMPRDKLMLPVNGQPMLRHIGLEIAELNYPTVAALPPHPHPRWDALDGLDILCCSFVESVEGLSGTLRAAVATIPQEIYPSLCRVGRSATSSSARFHRCIQGCQGQPIGHNMATNYRLWPTCTPNSISPPELPGVCFYKG